MYSTLEGTTPTTAPVVANSDLYSVIGQTTPTTALAVANSDMYSVVGQATPNTALAVANSDTYSVVGQATPNTALAVANSNTYSVVGQATANTALAVANSNMYSEIGQVNQNGRKNSDVSRVLQQTTVVNDLSSTYSEEAGVSLILSPVKPSTSRHYVTDGRVKNGSFSHMVTDPSDHTSCDLEKTSDASSSLGMCCTVMIFSALNFRN